MHTNTGHVATDRRGHFLHQRRVEGGTPRDRSRIHGRAVGSESGQTLLVHEGWDAQPRLLDNDPLLIDQLGGPCIGVTGRLP